MQSAVKVKLRGSQAFPMVRTGRWSNQLVAQHLVTHRTLQTLQITEIEIIERPPSTPGFRECKWRSSCGESTRLCWIPCTTRPHALLDWWTGTVANKVPGHKHVGRLISDLMCSRRMSASRNGDWVALKGAVRCLLGKPRLVWRFV